MLLKNYFSIYVGNKNSNHENKKGKYIFWTCNPVATKCNTWNFDGEYIILAGNNAVGNFHINFSNGKIEPYQRTSK
ncbi:hypothetical protein [Spiroplasma endosymbiont of Polydrusus pterygomalis]|uniref:hypothetical protein n=1 Tax=Spiroplasma endosymbiont of Polydrusus pterygomalis TaxID=3139327 RepID=UPI003CCB31EB